MIDRRRLCSGDEIARLLQRASRCGAHHIRLGWTGRQGTHPRI